MIPFALIATPIGAAISLTLIGITVAAIGHHYARRLLDPDRWIPPAGFYGDEPANDHTIGGES